jgi:dTMP kinase
MDPAFHRRVRRGFQEIARREPGRCVMVAADRPVETVPADIVRLVAERTGLVVP